MKKSAVSKKIKKIKNPALKRRIFDFFDFFETTNFSFFGGKMMGESLENDVKMMGESWEQCRKHDGKMMENDGKMMENNTNMKGK